MGLAFWRTYHEQQQEKAAKSKKPVEEASPLKALQLQQDPLKIEESARALEEAKPASEPTPMSHSRSSRAKKAQVD